MKYSAILLLAAAVVMTTFSLSAAGQTMDAAATMATADKNGDDRIDLEEYNKRMTDVFFLADTDKDGNLTVTEMQAVTNVDPEAFKMADRDGSQSLSLSEYLDALDKDFDAADRNHDGTIDMQELELMLSQ
jgi:Ca2+-binding EF-hand superfamily protein